MLQESKGKVMEMIMYIFLANLKKISYYSHPAILMVITSFYEQFFITWNPLVPILLKL